MKTKSLFIVIIGFLVFSLAGVSYGWQGRMGGMGDPYGLVQDESDFLIHPAGIADGKGVNFYGNYRFTWTDVIDWDYTLKIFAPILLERNPYRTSGDEWEHNALLGAAMPLGSGRMGIFFNYAGKRGDYDGTNHQEITFGPVFYHSYKMESDLDSFALRLLYGLPMGGFKLGGEIQLAYRREENKTSFTEDWIGNAGGVWAFYTNYPLGGSDWYNNLFPFMFPGDSKYWEGLLKGSLKGEMGPMKIAFTIKGGLILWGDNKYQFTASTPIGPSFVDASGDVKGWSLGSDLWLRYPLSKDLSLPFLLKVNYQKKTRTGEGWGMGSALGFGPGGTGEYKSDEKNFQVDIGGGVDKEFNKGTRVAAGVYYSYIVNKNNFQGSGFLPSTGDWGIINYSKYPDLTEHKVTLRIAGEKEINPMIAMRMGFNFFYAWGKEDFNYSDMNTAPIGFFYNTSFNGSQWGIGGWLGGTVKLERFSLEPFLGAGYQKMKATGDGPGSDSTMGSFSLDFDAKRTEWFIGGGFSIKF